MRKLAGEQRMRRNSRTGKRLRLIPLILGGYAAFLGFGLAVIGFAEIREGIGIVRLLIGIGMAGFGLLGIWDGVRDLVGPDKKPEQAPASQFILTDTSGNRTSNVTAEVLQRQLESLMESDKGGVFRLQILPPFAVQETGNISQIFCMYHELFGLTVFLDESMGGYESYHKSAEFDEAMNWFGKLLTGSADLSGWKKIENGYDDEENGEGEESSEGEDTEYEEGSICPGEAEETKWEESSICPGEVEDTEREESSTCTGEAGDSLIDTDEAAELAADFDKQDSLANTEEAGLGKSVVDSQETEERIKAFWHELQREQKGQMRGWHQLLVIFGESWHDEHKFFSIKDVELVIEGIHEGKYTKAVLEWGTRAVDLFPGVQNDLMVIWCTNNTGKGDTRFLAREGTVAQVKFWLVQYLDRGFFEETHGWVDVTAQIKRNI